MTPAHSPPAPPAARRRVRLLLATLGAFAVLAMGGYYAARWWSRSVERHEALTLAESGPPTKALPALKRCLERDPDNPELLKATAETLKKSGATVTDVEPYVERWCRASPDDPSAFRAWLDVTQRLSRYPEAAEAGERALQLDPHDEATRLALAGVYLKLGRYPDAACEFRHVLESSGSSNREVALGLARAEWEQGNHAEAARLTDGVLAGSPDHSGALILRAMIHHRAGEYERALAALAQVRPASHQERETVLYQRGLALDRLGRTDEAKKSHTELAALQNAARFATDAAQRPEDMGLQVRSAEAWLASGQPDAARQTLEGALGRLGPNRSALTMLAACYDALGQPDRARAARADAERAP